MIDPIFQTDNYQLARKLLDVSVLRQEAIATNVANAETAGFRRLDVSPDFATQLKSRLAAVGVNPSADSANGLSGATAARKVGDLAEALDTVQPQLAEDQTARSVRPDGNTVEIERELLAMNRNSVEFDYLSEVVSSNLKQLRIAITGRTA